MTCFYPANFRRRKIVDAETDTSQFLHPLSKKWISTTQYPVSGRRTLFRTDPADSSRGFYLWGNFRPFLDDLRILSVPDLRRSPVSFLTNGAGQSKKHQRRTTVADLSGLVSTEPVKISTFRHSGSTFTEPVATSFLFSTSVPAESAISPKFQFF